jgi:outer membrane receptor protein involved in Fe transport
MAGNRFHALALGLLASSALSGTAFAQSAPVDATPQTPTTESPAPATNATDVTSLPPTVQQAQDGQTAGPNEIIVTAQKREENVQDVPVSIQALGTRKLDQLNITNFQQYTQQLPSVSYNTSQSGGAVVYMRGVATGGDGNHSGSQPSVGD